MITRLIFPLVRVFISVNGCIDSRRRSCVLYQEKKSFFLLIAIAVVHMNDKHIDKTNGRIQIVNGDVIYSPNCNRTLTHRPILNPDSFEHDLFLPKYEKGKQRCIFDIDCSTYKFPLPWSTAYGWISFFPLRPFFDGPIFEQLLIPGRHQLEFDNEISKFFMPLSISKRWFNIEREILNAIDLI